ncbi:astacin-like metalloprotease toxin 4 [Ctenocephalides felis]|uniref:astacin-like metalloprotease toxin 4 n=1 Tax=Ctenocephalides felis TaxID=7515 RepID=UPI000E6E379C|nr:astacin-like metalloprotease toxin 4 [Ctenocephalides felis]
MTGKSAILNRAALWPNGVIPFMIDPSLRSVEYIVRQAIEQYHYYTCIRFIPRTNQQNYLRIFNGGGCYAHVGVTSGEQPVSLGRGCHNVGTAVHELGHSIGFYHEQNRSDRDEFLQIHWENIALTMRRQFEKLPASQTVLINKFDYKSIMIYGERAFAKDGVSKTMTALKTNERLTDPYNKPGLSQSDIFRINTLYNCR